MNSKLISKSLVLALLLAVFTVSATSAAPPSRGRVRAQKPVAAAFVGFWEGVMQFLRKEGCTIDPNGRLCPAPTPPPPSGLEEGCGLDPNGCATGG
jgi:hypothetical protein